MGVCRGDFFLVEIRGRLATTKQKSVVPGPRRACAMGVEALWRGWREEEEEEERPSCVLFIRVLQQADRGCGRRQQQQQQQFWMVFIATAAVHLASKECSAIGGFYLEGWG